MPCCRKKIDRENRRYSGLGIKTKQGSNGLKNILQVTKVKAGIPATTYENQDFINEILKLLNEVIVRRVDSLLHLAGVLGEV